MPAPRLHKTYEARSASATVSHNGASIAFLTHDDEELIFTMDRQTLALLQHRTAHALAPAADSSEQPERLTRCRNRHELLLDRFEPVVHHGAFLTFASNRSRTVRRSLVR